MSAPPDGWTPLELVRWTAAYFGRCGVPTPRLDAELLLAHVLGSERIDLYLRFEQPVNPAARERYRELVRRRAQERVPVAYLTGVREFWSLPFAVTPDVLIPRPETELLVRAAIEQRPRRFVEVGTGCGAVAAAVALELPEAWGIALDSSASALLLARANFVRLGLEQRVALLRADGLASLHGTFDLVLSNPPYVPTGTLGGLAPELRHEPRLALDGGVDGLDLVRRLVADAPRLLRGGRFVLEVGAGQAAPVAELMLAGGASEVEIRKDLAGIERVVMGSMGSARAHAPRGEVV